MKNNNILTLASTAVLGLLFSCKETPKTVETTQSETAQDSIACQFTNPILPSGADPYSTFLNGKYYYTNTVGNRLILWKTDNLADLAHAEQTTIWTPPEGTEYSRDIWAPEAHFINGKWYVYFAADDGHNETHRMYVLENASADPFAGEWVFKGKLATPSDKWAIDGNVYTFNGQLYMIWSGWEGDVNGTQNIYIAKMKDPFTLEGKRALLSTPTYDWEKHGDLGEHSNPPHVNVNEGPQFLEHNNKLFIVFSASGCWTDYYSLGLLELGGTDPMDPNAWTKHQEPIFKQDPANGVYAPGHNSFFKSPDGKEDWILYHANANSGDGCGGKRSPRMQRINWKEDGTPELGAPLATQTLIQLPSGTPGTADCK